MSRTASIGGITAPDSHIAREVAALARQVHDPAILNHVHRTYWFAEFLAQKREVRFDREIVYIASLLHDLGLTDRYCAEHRFEIDGANAAAHFLHAHAYPKPGIDMVWDGIALHSSDVAAFKAPEIALVHLGAHVDVMGLNIEEISPQLIDDTLQLYPRLGFKKAFTEALAEIARRKPFTAIGTGLGDIGRALLPGFAVPDVCALLLDAPFDS
ncbi:HD domain-containing protein [Sphingomonas morindae]|uniref:HD domain-containing protein n=1 Tax=Sphingomonas morindae TaxID=1541170 RepID=A0ABY4X933_9SPHN|nr:HD domain-containing protein [Sphingomonas morindae]USI73447.1 HD domain-containing protein [Sphingomonas morindae]